MEHPLAHVERSQRTKRLRPWRPPDPPVGLTQRDGPTIDDLVAATARRASRSALRVAGATTQELTCQDRKAKAKGAVSASHGDVSQRTRCGVSTRCQTRLRGVGWLLKLVVRASLRKRRPPRVISTQAAWMKLVAQCTCVQHALARPTRAAPAACPLPPGPVCPRLSFRFALRQPVKRKTPPPRVRARDRGR